jgi:uncharacterized protein (TIGR02284 family)
MDGVPAVNRDPSLAILHDLIETSKEGERGFALAARDNREPGLMDMLKDAEESCRAAAIEICDQLQLIGEPLERQQVVPGRVHRGWIDFRAIPIRRDTKLILEECERGQDYARSLYETALRLELPEAARRVVERQYERVVAIQARVRLLRNRYPATEIPRAAGSRFERT